MVAVYLALLICPFLAIILTFPYVVYEYREKENINVTRCAEVYLMIAFTFAAYFMTMLPFPSVHILRGMFLPLLRLMLLLFLLLLISCSSLF